LSWHWGQDLYRDLLGISGGKERIRHFIADYGAKGAPDENLDQFIRALHADKTAIYTQMVEGHELKLRPGIRELISEAREKGFRLAIATTTSPSNVDILLNANFGDEGQGLFEVICAGDSVPKKKPAPDVYLQTLEQLGLPAANCVAIEDSRNGLLSAHGAGIATIVIPDPYTYDQNFDEAALVVNDLGSFDFSMIETLLT